MSKDEVTARRRTHVEIVCMFILAIVLAIVLGILIAVMFDRTTDEYASFTCVEIAKVNGTKIGIYVHDDTGVMYMAWASGYKGGLTVMLDPDGMPLIWNG